MLKITNTCDDIKIKELNGIPFAIINGNIFLFNINESFIEKFTIELIDNKLGDINHITLYQFDFYETIDSFKKGLHMLIDYIIFMDQKLVDKLNIIVTNTIFQKAVNETIDKSQKKISRMNDYIYPQRSIVDLTAIEDSMEISFVPTEYKKTMTSILMKIVYDKEFIETIDTPKDNMIHRVKINHDYFMFNVSKIVSSFYGSMNSSKTMDDGNLKLDIYNIISEEDVPNGL